MQKRTTEVAAGYAQVCVCIEKVEPRVCSKVIILCSTVIILCSKVVQCELGASLRLHRERRA